jgi:hypothetical protein
MVFEGICILTNDVSRLARFYRELFYALMFSSPDLDKTYAPALGVSSIRHQ